MVFFFAKIKPKSQQSQLILAMVRSGFFSFGFFFSRKKNWWQFSQYHHALLMKLVTKCYLEPIFNKVNVFSLFRTMLLLNYLCSGKSNSCVMLIERSARPALESQVLRFSFRSVFFSSNVEINNLRFFFREKKTD